MYKSNKLVYGVGRKGSDPSYENGGMVLSYTTWCNMLMRCYSEESHDIHPTYIDCSVCDQWLYYPNFKEWFDKNYVKGMYLDKDLTNLGNKIYSPENCSFIPASINVLINRNDKIRGKYPQGVKLDKRYGKYTAALKVNGKQKHLGTFIKVDEAKEAYKKAKHKYVKQMAKACFLSKSITKPIYNNLLSWRV